MRMSKRLLSLAVLAAVGSPATVFATNGMNLEGYGPIATGMGGASSAYDNGTAAVMNNPATLGMMAEGNRVDAAIGLLAPDVDSSAMGMAWPSSANSFLMPAVGYAHKSGRLTYGVGVFAQGGMGTEYDVGPGATMSTMGMPPNANVTATVAGWQERSEVGVGRAILPLAYDVNDQLTIGGSLDFVWANMDLQMAMPGAAMQDMLPGGSQAMGSLGGTMVDALMPMINLGLVNIHAGYFDFSDDNDFTGEAFGSGFAGKLGFTYRVDDKLTLGGSYHSETDLSDLEANDATVTMAVNMLGLNTTMPMNGKVKIRNFQWPETMSLGLAYEPDDRFLVAFDVKHIKWSDVMKDFKMSFVATDGLFAGQTLEATMLQDWDDQTAFQAGVAYKATEALTVRAGANISRNPIPDTTLHYLFPAIIENHFTFGLGYQFSPSSQVNASYVHAPEVRTTTSTGMEVTHSQDNWQVMYSYLF